MSATTGMSREPRRRRRGTRTRRAAGCLLAVLALLAGLPPDPVARFTGSARADAADDEPERLCPVCGTVQELLPVLGGCVLFNHVDSDGCNRDVAENYARVVHLCTACGYAAPRAAFAETLDAAAAAAVRGVLRTEGERAGAVLAAEMTLDQTFDRAVLCARAAGAADDRLREIAWYGAWVERTRASGATDAALRRSRLSTEWSDASARLDTAWFAERAIAAAQARPTPPRHDVAARWAAARAGREPSAVTEPVAVDLLCAAALARSAGETAIARRIAESIPAEAGDVVGPARDALLVSIAREASFQTRVVAAGGAPAGLVRRRPAGYADFLLAETLRRLGRRDEAMARYAAATDAGLALLALEQVRRVVQDADTPDLRRKVDAARPAAIEQALRDFVSGDLFGDESFPGLLDVSPVVLARGTAALLRSSDPRVRRNAVSFPCYSYAPDAEVVHDLASVAADADADAAARVAALRALASSDGEEARLALEAATRSEDANVRDAAVAALGSAGDEASTARLVALHGTANDGTLCDALARLTNRDVTPDTWDAFREWFAASKDAGRRAWVAEGFRWAGVTAQDTAGAAEPTNAALVELVTDKRHWVRANALRLLRERTGVAYGEWIRPSAVGDGPDEDQLASVRDVWRAILERLR